jgi:hypothetical protein
MSELFITEEPHTQSALLSELSPGNGNMTGVTALVHNGFVVPALIERAGKRTLLRFVV